MTRAKTMTDAEREFEARRFFWSMMDRTNAVVDVETAQRQIAKLAEALPPFTRLRPAQSSPSTTEKNDG